MCRLSPKPAHRRPAPPAIRSEIENSLDRQRAAVYAALCLTVIFALPRTLLAAAPQAGEIADDDALRRSTAVALNYCRASFHRIRRHPVKWVLLEEQEKVLNNLNLNGVADEELLRLYTALLIEIGDVQIADRELQIVQERFLRSFVRQFAVDAFVIGTQIASQQHWAAVKTGARSWWDYRSMAWNRDLDAWQIEKERMLALVDKSSQLLDTFWKLARRRNIPDHWLIRDDDLDRLQQALREPQLEVRLRVLKRMQRFMQCYPPYWYYLARTQQALGKLSAAEETYVTLQRLATGHFRKDDMLAAALANLAAIRQFRKEPNAHQAATDALQYSTSVWEANLLCARVLAEHRRFREAEDAVLRNLDVDLETQHSLSALALLYCRWDNDDKLLELLRDAPTVRRLPMPILLFCTAHLDAGRRPQPILPFIASSIEASVERHFGEDDLVVRGVPTWQLQQARVSLEMLGHRCTQAPQFMAKQVHELRYAQVLEAGSPLASESNGLGVTLVLEYPGLQTIRLHMQQTEGESNDRPGPLGQAKLRPASLLAPAATRLRLTRVDVGDVSLRFAATSAARGSSGRQHAAPPHVPTAADPAE